MRRIPAFVWGHVLGALVVGVVGGAFLDLTAVVTFGATLAAAAVISALACWWWPGFDAAAWKLWLVATFANPVMLAALVWTVIERECLMGGLAGLDCLFAEVGPVAAAACLPSPLIGLLVRALVRR